MAAGIRSPLIDLSHPLDDNVPVYPGDPSFHCRQSCTVRETGFAVCELSFSSHVGTHIDAPSHRFDGAQTVDSIPLERLIRQVLVIDLSHKSARAAIGLSDIAPYEQRVQDGMAIFLRTGWDRFWADKSGKYFEHPYVERAVAERLVSLGAVVLGVDTMSPDPISEEDSSVDVHDVVLGAGRIIAENLTNLQALQDAQEADATAKVMVCLAPLKITGCDGSPVRAFGWVEHGP